MNTQAFEEFCDECGEPAEMHVTEIGQAGQISVRHLCFEHSMPEGMTEELKTRFRARRIQRRFGT